MIPVLQALSSLGPARTDHGRWSCQYLSAYGHGTWQIIQATNQYLSQHTVGNITNFIVFFLLLELGKLTINQWGFGVPHFESCRAIFVCRMPNLCPNMCLIVPSCPIWFPDLPRCSRWVCPKMDSMVDHNFHHWNMTIGVLSEKKKNLTKNNNIPSYWKCSQTRENSGFHVKYEAASPFLASHSQVLRHHVFGPRGEWALHRHLHGLARTCPCTWHKMVGECNFFLENAQWHPYNNS